MSFFSCVCNSLSYFFFFFNDTATTEIYTLSLHDALPISAAGPAGAGRRDVSELAVRGGLVVTPDRSEEHTSELQSRRDLVCRLLLEKKKKKKKKRKKNTQFNNNKRHRTHTSLNYVLQ